MTTSRPLFCSDCKANMPRLRPQERCFSCFQFLETSSSLCPACQKSCDPFRCAAVFNYESPASALIKQLKYGGRQELAPLMASWMLIQLQDLDFPWPDALVAVPQSFPRRLVRGYNPSAQLASSLGKLMKVPVLSPLRRCWSALPQASKNAEERNHMPQEFFLRSASLLTDKKILMIDDVITTGTTLKRCAGALQPAFPSAVYGLGFCLA